ncbi:ATP-binding protein [Streptomyces sp. NK08204]|uniref:ATP-binding protein n=1 Tax=Streptomyces sp. NK08204 TaxID=2873260 RepID=UPI001CEC9310|nr:ATP-binding protein [Streptomyces sp. NK08204]
MDPIDPGPEEQSHAPSRRPPRDSLGTDFGPGAPAPARTERLVCGDFLLTVNPVDGSEIAPCRPAERPGRPRKRTAAERAETERAARPPVPPGPAGPTLPLLERQDERERLVRLLARGRSVRLTGPGGCGRTALLDLVAEDCLDLAPDGVVRLSGFHRTAGDLLHDLFRAVHDAPRYRPDRDELLELVREIGAVVVVDDLEFGGAALDELLDATPECAFLFGATPDVPVPSVESDVEEVFLPGLDRAGGVEILERAVGRVLTEEEANWAGDLWFESEGLPLRFVQAGALLRQRDELRAGADPVDEYGVFDGVRIPVGAPPEPEDDVPLPSLGEAAAPAPLLASRLSGSARTTLRFAVALAGEVPHQAHLPALVGDTHADAALGELVSCGLVSPVGSRYRLAAGVQTQLEAAGYADGAPARAHTVAEHYTWWAGHPSVTAERVCAEADAVLAALTAVVPATSSRLSAPGQEGSSTPAEKEESCAVRLARTAAPAFAAGLHWNAWERALRSGAEASRLSGEVSEQAYFHHELGVHALCAGQLDRARAELEASIGLRGVLADKRGTVAGRRALALVSDRAGHLPGVPVPLPAGEVPSHARHDDPTPSPTGAPALFPPSYTTSPTAQTQVIPRPPAGRSEGGLRRLARRNLVVAGSGALLVAVLGTVITLGMTSHESADDNPADQVTNVDPSTSQGADDGDAGADPGTGTSSTASTTPTSRPTPPAPAGTYATTPAAPAPTPRGTEGAGDGSTTSAPPHPTTTPSSPTPTPTDSSPTPATTSPTPTGTSGSPTPTGSASTTPTTTNTAGGPTTATGSAGAGQGSGAVM